MRMPPGYSIDSVVTRNGNVVLRITTARHLLSVQISPTGQIETLGPDLLVTWAEPKKEVDA